METTETRIARLDEQVKTLVDKVNKNQDAVANVNSWMASVDNTLSSMNYRFSSVEQNVTRSVEAINEFNSIKNKVIGASLAGKWVWTALGVGFTLLYAFHGSIIKILTTPWR